VLDNGRGDESDAVLQHGRYGVSLSWPLKPDPYRFPPGYADQITHRAQMKPEVVFGFENAGWPALLVDKAGLIVRYNKAAASTFGQALSGDTDTPLTRIWSPENRATAEAFLEKWQRQPAASSSLQFHVRGQQVSFTTVVCALDHEGQTYFVFQLFPDMGGGIGAADSPLAEGTVQKNKLDLALQLARSVALDFNNALAGVLGHSSLLLSRAEPDHPWRKSLLEIEKAAEKGADIANSLRSFSRQEKEPSAAASANLNTIIQQAASGLTIAPDGSPVRWDFKLEPRLFSTKLDAAKIQQAFARIFENAVQALNGGGAIVVSTRNLDLALPTQDRNARLAPGAYVCTEIADTGCGIETTVLPRIFEPFFTTKGSPRHRGLGLAWVYGVVTNHGGGIAVSSKTGIGTSVRIYLPADKRIVENSAGAPEDLTGTETILLVDDEDIVLNMAQTVLEAHGYKVLTAESGQNALRLLSGTGFTADLLLTDLVMPRMGGLELAEAASGVAPDMPVLVMTGAAWPPEKKDVMHIEKPFTSDELLKLVRQALQGKRPDPGANSGKAKPGPGA
jgi:signal transduction histidine kinase